MIERKNISQAEANKIVATEEWDFADVKAIEIKPAKLSKTISAFANTSGGEIYVGIAENQNSEKKARQWLGFADIEAANAHLQVIETLGKIANYYHATFLTSETRLGVVLHLVILKTTSILNATDGLPYIRKGAQNLPVNTPDGLARLRLNKGIVSFEDETVKIDPKYLFESSVATSFMKSVVPRARTSEWLESQFLITDKAPTVAGILLFSDHPQAALPKRSAVKIFRYKTRSEEGDRDTLAFDPITVEGCLYQLIAEVVSKTKKLIEGIKRLGASGLEDVSYPDETMHEILTNAILHRDYSIAADILVRIYDNRIEVESPGRLPGHVTVQNILGSQTARNPKIVRMINKFPNPPNKDVGEGLNTAFEAMKKLKLKAPEIEEKEHSVVVYIGHAPLASPEETVLKYLEINVEITNKIGRDLTGIRSENSMKDVFLRLKKRKLIEPIPEKKGSSSAWRKCSTAVSRKP